MKKVLAFGLTLLLLLGSFCLGTAADKFTFSVKSYDVSGNALHILWNGDEAPSGIEFEEAVIAGKDCPVVSDSTANTMDIDISHLPAGRYTSVKLQYAHGDTIEKVTAAVDFVRSGFSSVSLSSTISTGGIVTITAYDEAGQLLAGYKLKVSIGTMTNMSEVTDASGKFTSVLSLKEGDRLCYEGEETISGQVVYSAVAAKELTYTAQKMTTVAEEKTTTAVAETTSSATQETTAVAEKTEADGDNIPESTKSYAWIRGAGTTASAEDGKVALNVSIDENMLTEFGMSEGDFAGNARLFVNQDDYTGLVGRTANQLMLGISTALAEPTPLQLQTCMAGISKFSSYPEAERKTVSFNLQLLIANKDGSSLTPVAVMPVGTTYQVQLPIPKSMKKCALLAVTYADGTSLAVPQEVVASDGCVLIQVDSLGEYTLIGFGVEKDQKAGGISWWVVLLFVVGLLLLGGGGALLYFFVLRKPAPEAETAVAESSTDCVVAPLTEEDEIDIYSGRTDMPPRDDE